MCNVEDFSSEIFFAVTDAGGTPACYEIVIGPEPNSGFIFMDKDDPTCSLKSGTGTIISYLSGYAGSTLTWLPYFLSDISGTMDFVEDTSLTEPNLVVSLTGSVFDATLQLPSCKKMYCNKNDLYYAEIFVSYGGTCFFIDFLRDQLRGDPSDSDCSVKSKMGTKFSNHDGYNGNSAKFSADGPAGYSGTMDFLLDENVTKETLEINSFSENIFDVTR